MKHDSLTKPLLRLFHSPLLFQLRFVGLLQDGAHTLLRLEVLGDASAVTK
jgi:hypothetical protein